MAKHSVAELGALATDALIKAGASQAMAEATSRALLYAESRSLPSHGLSRIPQYATHLRNGRVDGNAIATVVKGKPAEIGRAHV